MVCCETHHLFFENKYDELLTFPLFLSLRVETNINNNLIVQSYGNKDSLHNGKQKR